MSTEGLDSHEIQWMQESTDGVHNLRNDGLDFAIPPQEKFRSGHLLGNAVPLSRVVPVDVLAESGEEICGNVHSPDSSSLQNSHSRREIPYGANGVNNYGIDGYSNSSSSMDAVQQSVRQNGKKEGMSESTNEEEEGSSEACGSSSFLGRMGRGEGEGIRGQRGGYAADCNLSEDQYQGNTAAYVDQGFHVSAPPFHGSLDEVNQTIDPTTNLTSCEIPHKAAFNAYSAEGDINSYRNSESQNANRDIRSPTVDIETSAPSKILALKVPTFHACEQGPWYSVIAYDACVRLCLHAWAQGCMDAPIFLENECLLLRNSFGLQQIMLQSQEELLEKHSSEPLEGTMLQKRTFGKLKVQVHRVRMSLRRPILKQCLFKDQKSNFQSTVSLRLASLRGVKVLPSIPANISFSRAYMQGSTQYMKQVSALLKTQVNSLNACTCAVPRVEESYFCHLRLKSLAEENMTRMQVGSGEKHVFFPDSMGDDLIVEVHDSKGKILGQAVVRLADIVGDPSEKVRWWSIYREPENECVGQIQLYVKYSTATDESNPLRCGSVAETVAYDILLEVAMKVQNFHQRSLLLHGPWKWLLAEFASYYGVSDAYTRLRYLSYILDVATPTTYCLTLVHDLLAPVLLRTGNERTLSHQENRILGAIEVQIDIVLALVFENYKALDESLPSGIVEVFRPSTSIPAAALVPAVNLYKLLHDILSPEAQLKLCSYFQVAAKKISRMQLSETDELIASSIGGISTSSNGGPMMEAVTLTTAYEKMKNLCLNIRNEIFIDIGIDDQHLLPSFVELKNISASIYSVELCNRLREFLIAFPPTSPSPHVVDLIIAAADIQKDLLHWNICNVKGGVDAKELFHLYIIIWIQDKHLQLLEKCNQDKAKCSAIRTPHLSNPFVDDMYDLLRSTLNEYEVIIRRWPEYNSLLENVIANVEKSIIEALERQYANVLAPLKHALTPKKFGLKYVQKLAKCSNLRPYAVPDELGVLMNSIKRLLDVLRPTVEAKFNSWASYMLDGVNNSIGERLSEVTVTLRAKFRNYLQAIAEKLVENIRSRRATRLKMIIRDSKDFIAESDIRNRMQPLKDELLKMIKRLHAIFEMRVFVLLCRCFWDRMGQDVLTFLENKKNRIWYGSARVAVSILDETFGSQMQQLLGNAVQRELEPPSSIMQVRSLLCNCLPSHKNSNFNY
ncbi:uncharacterized protein LOC110025591 isoform X2 [Phalaenopsis equestris]|uniref:uncharacterized protein LOC110025591 isoform X2 n=1 Tax=Phalaenopsis equestris TaxID=78828 RepID=UPI0009E554C0|nr:uncharacterized protein LOC110025591 isoform X2 [Phalaenopsis equestris]